MIDAALLMGIVGAAVGIIIGIVIYSEISDATYDGYSTIVTSINQTFYNWASANQDATSWSDSGVIKYGLTNVSLPPESIITSVQLKVTNNASSSGNAVIGIYDTNLNLIGTSNQVNGITNLDTPVFTFTNDPVVPNDGFIKVAVRSTGLINWYTEAFVGGGMYVDNTLSTSFPEMELSLNGTQESANSRLFTDIDYIIENEVQTTLTGRDAAPAEHTRADGIAFTILSIIPISMFFGLFAMFGGFKND